MPSSDSPISQLVRHGLAEHGAEHDHIGDAGQRLERDGQRDPAGLRLGHEIPHLAEPRRQEQREPDDDEHRDDLERAPHEPLGLELGGHRDGG
jgi:hypothetical protein